MITQSELKKLVHYDPLTGIFTRKVSSNAFNIGDIATSDTGNDYLKIYINREQYLAHRLAWLYVHGYFPENDIDHKDRVRDNNRIKNLRESSRQCNIRNGSLRCNNKTGIKGVVKNNNIKFPTWRSNIFISGKQYCLGTHKSFGEAVCHRLAAEQCLGWEGCDLHSEAYKYVMKNIQKDI